MKVGFIGLGSMGLPMATNLLKASHDLIVYNRTRGRAEELAKQGARVAGSPREATAGVEVLITMLADDTAVESVMFGDQGALPGLSKGAIHASMSTIGHALSRRLNTEHQARGQGYVAAPVFGRPDAARAAQLWIVTAGSAQAIERCRPLFEAMGQGVEIVGDDPPKANVVKLAGNFILASAIEAMGGGLRAGAEAWGRAQPVPRDRERAADALAGLRELRHPHRQPALGAGRLQITSRSQGCASCAGRRRRSHRPHAARQPGA